MAEPLIQHGQNSLAYRNIELNGEILNATPLHHQLD